MALITTVGAAYALQNYVATTRSYQPQLGVFPGLHIIEVGVVEMVAHRFI